MANQTEHIRQLLQLYIANQATDQQVKELFAFLKDSANDAISKELLEEAGQPDLTGQYPGNPDSSWEQMLSKNQDLRSNWEARQRKVLPLWRWIAAAVLISGIATAVMISSQKKNKPMPTIAAATGNKAVLTLANGDTVLLDSLGSGTIAKQGNVAVVKLPGGKIRYDVNGGGNSGTMINKVATPVGGQFQLTLPDGTKVWLNATSSVTYPVAFEGTRRNIKVGGEVYLEIAQDKEHPFIIDVDGKSKVEVLGTTVNINSYGDDGKISTTLVEGSVKVAGVQIRPGQQALVNISTSDVTVAEVPDIEQETAWRNGIFYFRNASLPLVLKQLERWYGINIQYKGEAPAFSINGKMDRKLTLSEIVDFLTTMGVKCNISGNTLIISGK